MTAKLLLPDHIATKLKCDLCRGYLSVPPISSYEDKVSCGRCNPGWPRNLVYEHLAQFVMFPCTYCDEKLSWADVPKHEQKCRRNIVLCPSGRAKNYKPSALGEYHGECQTRSVACPFDYCDTRYEVRHVLPHFQKFHKDYVFVGNTVSARKNMKEEKVWNFNAENRVCLLVHRQTPFLLFVHSDCNYDESNGDLASYEYFFGVFSLCQHPCDVKYAATVGLASDTDASSRTMADQEVKPFNQRLHSVNFLRIGLVKQRSFNFMTTHFQNLRKSPNLKLTYTVELADGGEPAGERFEPKACLYGKSFECPICKEYMHPPVYNCDLGHSVCKSCKLKMVVCPFCKAFIGNSRNFAFEDILETLQIACQNEGKGCAYTGKVPELKLHELTCLYNV